MQKRSLVNRAKKQGMPPGTLINLGEQNTADQRIDLIDYTQDELLILEDITFEESMKYLNQSSCTWLHIRGLSDPHLIEKLGATLDLHPLILEDVLNPSQRSKLDEYQHHLFLVLRLLRYDENVKQLQDEQINIIFTKNYVVTISEKEHPLFEPIKQRIRSPTSRLRRNGTDYLCYALIDAIVDYYFILLVQIDDQLNALEDSLGNNTDEQQGIEAIQKLKKEISYLQKAIWPVRELINQLIRNDNTLFKNTTKTYLHDVYDHIIQAVDTIDNFREQTLSLVDMHMSLSSKRLNETMKVLTVVSTIFVPLTFLASIYGMNFLKVPGIDYEWGFHILIISMVIVGIIMVSYFKSKKWI
ncbi:MAG: magnesium/cobalt transporter CorA [Parachlamydiales bacterium]|jgi:magnesium transporter